ncbi:amylosucrase [Novimethylophilus kurashikiensis]|uniref:Amylosucrase n=1 Tax=Novimethylophilus kurashikiensis TaxID=1825523 RepID=A0A2R5F6K7_9PROT|nr:amylosucrase [Novimethylophilus kurashikiensis]GBG13499.1 amylosucrase [Novimethylophilus kurashikiensis]
MYEQVSHSLLNEMLQSIKPGVRSVDLQHFYTRLGANFFAIYSLFHVLYGERDDFKEQMRRLVETMVRQYVQRPAELKTLDLEREKDHTWFLHQKWVGMALYCREFGGDLAGLQSHLNFLQDLGVNMLHIMPILDCPKGRSDGGYAVRDFRNIDTRIGSLDDLDELIANLRKRGILLTLDVVVNHTSDEHEWAVKARQGEQTYQDYYYVFDTRETPDMFEESMPEVFPETAPGNFTWNEEMGKWVMTVFHNYQWDLNYRNPAVFIEMLDIILFWANRGADILRLDAVAFLWKEIGTTCQNERKAHLILQLMKDCCQVTAPGVLFIAEAIVAPVEIIKYFGEDAINAKECEIAYNATFMALLWEAVATKKTTLLARGLRSIPNKLERATWLNYVRCHDDIGWGFSDIDIQQAGYDPRQHRQFLVDYFTGAFEGSNAIGLAFARNEKTGDARISGSTASLTGLEYALANNLPDEVESSIKTILLLHSMILAFGGIPLLYYGDAIGTPNDRSYMEDEHKFNDNRWIHRPRMDWDKAERRNMPGTVEYQVFTALKKMIAVRKEIKAFADLDNRTLIDVDNPHLFVFSRFDYPSSQSKVLVVGNFALTPQPLALEPLRKMGFFTLESVKDLYSGEQFSTRQDNLLIPAQTFYWLET